MSLDLYLSPKKCDSCGHGDKGLHFNVTYNLSEMWYELYPNDERMLLIENMKGSESYALLDKAVKDFIKHKNRLITLNPANGWGSYDGFLKTLIEMRASANQNPDWIWDASR